MIDLHMHTTYSDGTDSLKEVLQKAQSKGLSVISITDHNNCDAYFELEKLKVSDYYTGKIIAGIELNTKAEGVPIEILGYNIDYKKMNELAKKTYLSPEKRNQVEFERLVNKCKKAGMALDDDVLEKFDKKDFASVAIHKSITNHEENKDKLNERSWNSSRDFYRDYMSNPSTPLYVEMDDIVPDLDTAINLVKVAGGLVFIPHIYEYRDNTPKVLDYILKNGRLDGIECYYTTFTDTQHEYILNLTKEKGLFISGGSDYHGSRKPDTDLGVGHGNLKIPESIQEPWAKYIF
ncbi:MAG: PHP domain-containing protein [Clostridia bacterium]|nr:PHP domain-containing protein [Clostridia bacterium]